MDFRPERGHDRLLAPPVLTGLIVDRTGSFVPALTIGGIVMAVGAAIHYSMVGAPTTDANLCDHPASLPIAVSR
jgi:hypothetical protein